MKPALFLDRDGVINVDKGYVHKIEDWEFRPGIFDVIRGFRALGHLVIVVTNQSGIGRGLFTEREYKDLNLHMQGRLLIEHATVTAAYHCPHISEDNCDCRKPKPGLILQAASDWNIDLTASTLIGDRDTDIKAGQAAGVGHLILWRNKEK